LISFQPCLIRLAEGNLRTTPHGVSAVDRNLSADVGVERLAVSQLANQRLLSGRQRTELSRRKQRVVRLARRRVHLARASLHRLRSLALVGVVAERFPRMFKTLELGGLVTLLYQPNDTVDVRTNRVPRPVAGLALASVLRTVALVVSDTLACRVPPRAQRVLVATTNSALVLAEIGLRDASRTIGSYYDILSL